MPYIDGISAMTAILIFNLYAELPGRSDSDRGGGLSCAPGVLLISSAGQKGQFILLADDRIGAQVDKRRLPDKDRYGVL